MSEMGPCQPFLPAFCSKSISDQALEFIEMILSILRHPITRLISVCKCTKDKHFRCFLFFL